MKSEFSELPLLPPLQQALSQMGFAKMTPVQASCIPEMLAGHDLIAESPTGSGKTAAFVLPVLQKITLGVLRPQALVLCPTRELCDQVLRESRKFSLHLAGFRAVALVGGQEYQPQYKALEKGAHLIVGTPGRTLEHLRARSFALDELRTLILDEADRMLEAGFSDEMSQILDLLPHARQTAFFSATFPAAVEALSRRYQTQPKRFRSEGTSQSSPQIRQYVYPAENEQKEETLIRVLAQHPSPRTLIFCRTKATVRSLGERLEKEGVSCQVLHGDMEQNDRDRVTSLFRGGSVRVLVATDIAARGLDIDGLELVVNVDLPSSAEIYIHRIGRTGRAGRSGVAVSLATAYEAEKLAAIETKTGASMIRQVLGARAEISASMRAGATRTIQISGGRNDKLRPGDILGALTAQPQPIKGSNIGKIEIRDRFSFIAVAASQADEALEKLRAVKIKGSRFKAYPVE